MVPVFSQGYNYEFNYKPYILIPYENIQNLSKLEKNHIKWWKTSNVSNHIPIWKYQKGRIQRNIYIYIDTKSIVKRVINTRK